MDPCSSPYIIPVIVFPTHSLEQYEAPGRQGFDVTFDGLVDAAAEPDDQPRLFQSAYARFSAHTMPQAPEGPEIPEI